MHRLFYHLCWIFALAGCSFVECEEPKGMKGLLTEDDFRFASQVGYGDYFSVDFPSNKVGYISGRGGKILKTTDGGQTFDDVSMTIDDLSEFDSYGIDFIDAKTGYIILTKGSEKSYLKKTTDGGVSWKNVNGLQMHTWRSVKFISPLVGFVMGLELEGNMFGQGVLYKTVDGGESWDRVTGLNCHAIRRIDYVDGVFYLACDFGECFKSTDSGLTWTKLHITYPVATQCLVTVAVKFKDRFNGILLTNIGTSGGFIMRTQDGGLSWNEIKLVDASQKSVVKLNYYFDVEYDGHNSYIIGGNVATNKASILTNGGGEFWSELTPKFGRVMDVTKLDNGRLCFVGLNSSVLITK